MDTQSQTMKSAPFLTIALATTLLLCSIPLACGASEPSSAVSFSPTSIDYGQIPAHEHPTQLLRVRFDRRIFQSDHLPILRLQSINGPSLSLFSRSDTPNAIVLVYRVTLVQDAEIGPLDDCLILARDTTASNEDSETRSAEDAGVRVRGEVIQGLDVGSKKIDFGQVKSGKIAVKEVEVGIFHGGMFELKSDVRPVWPDIWNMSVTSSSPYVTAPEKRGFGLNGSSWQTWKIVLSPKTPVGVLQAKLVFRTGNGFSVAVPVLAKVTAAGQSEPNHSRKH